YALTEKNAKPAVPFGGKYRIIDFPMSNCVNSGIDTVGVLTQYQPLELNEYIGNGQPWDLDRVNGGVMVLPPYQGKSSSDWYRGTANAIYQNMAFIKRYNPDYVLILSGDHIYKMDYSKMLEIHKQNDADCTIAVLEVPMSEAHRFGILNTDETGRIIEFEEKPKNPKSNKASMGIYIFSREALEVYLRRDELDRNSSNDFGKNVIPAMLADGKRMFSYVFDGYWKDVGTIKSLWEANMDLLGKEPKFDIYDKKWRIFYRHNAEPPQYIRAGATIRNSMITEGCDISGTVENSVISSGVRIEEGAVVRDSVILGGVTVKRGAHVDFAIIDGDSVIGEGATVGAPLGKDSDITVVGGGIEIKAGKTVKCGAMVDHANVGEI
ncbi:MAG: glucose-1-phosphate adenylyltransferase, partial [Clostridia bacterium]|nr:glucose-1-phosphate adenylyltransferase [Clostridia bacterium]